jgi:hypothetical protein
MNFPYSQSLWAVTCTAFLRRTDIVPGHFTARNLCRNRSSTKMTKAVLPERGYPSAPTILLARPRRKGVVEGGVLTNIHGKSLTQKAFDDA